MKKYYITVKCEYQLEIEAQTEEEAIEIAESGVGYGGYDLTDLHNFSYYVDHEEEL